MSDLDDVIRARGFSGRDELARMVAAVDLTPPGAIAAFLDWRDLDGSRAGLRALLDAQAEGRVPVSRSDCYVPTAAGLEAARG